MGHGMSAHLGRGERGSDSWPMTLLGGNKRLQEKGLRGLICVDSVGLSLATPVQHLQTQTTSARSCVTAPTLTGHCLRWPTVSMPLASSRCM